MTERPKIDAHSGHTSKNNTRISLYDKAHLAMISLMHDTMYYLFVNPNRLLTAAGLAANQKVLEVGCGPGFFTIPAAKIVGTKGRLYAIDINPAAIEKARRKTKEKGFGNIEAFQADVAKTGLPDESIDVAFLFGILHSLKDLDSVLLEMHRVLNKNGVLAAQRSAWSEKTLLRRFTEQGLFRFIGKESRIYRFARV